MRRRPWAVVLGFLILLAIVAAWRAQLGGGGFAAGRAIMEIRLQRLTAAVLVGVALGAGGVLLQSLLRNPLASPDLLGLASGASLAVMVVIFAAYRAGASASSSWTGVNGAAALAGSFAALGAVYSLSQRRGALDPVSLVLIGVMVSVMCGAITIFLSHQLPDGGVAQARWTFGGISDELTWWHLGPLAAVVLGASFVGFRIAPAMDAASLTDDEAASLGVPLRRLRLIQFAIAGVLTAAAVVMAGPIGFVGLVCPHVVRLTAGPAHRPLVVGAALAGAVLIVAADALVKMLNLGSGRLPLGVLTALIGGPTFVWLLRRERGSIE